MGRRKRGGVPGPVSWIPAWVSMAASGAVGVAAGASASMEGERIMEWVERLGGWAVVILVVRWLLSRTDRLIGQVGDLANENRTNHARLVRIGEATSARLEVLERCTATCPLRRPDFPWSPPPPPADPNPTPAPFLPPSED